MLLLSILASSIDAFLFGISFGIHKIRLSLKTILITSLFPFFFCLLALYLARYVAAYMDGAVQHDLSFLIYLILAIYMYYQKHSKEYNEGNLIDGNHDHVISGSEVLVLAISLSLDTWIIALPLGFISSNFLWIALSFGITSGILLCAGYYLATYLSAHIPCRMLSFSWVIFILLALLHS